MMQKHIDQEVDGDEKDSEDDPEVSRKTSAGWLDWVRCNLYAVHHERGEQADLLCHQTIFEQAL
jgi:hypothetical protein